MSQEFYVWLAGVFFWYPDWMRDYGLLLVS